ncbi:fungal-specific transcription factor domain-containing protein [Aspergillus nidulans var. acristatus]
MSDSHSSACSPFENRRKDPKVSRACDSCRAKKIRCSGTLPCNICSRRRLSCSYASRYARGRPPTPPPHTPSHLERSTDSGRELTPNSQTNATESRATSELIIEGQYFDLTSGPSFLHRATSKLSAQRGQYVAHGYHDVQGNQLLASAGDQPFYQGNSSAEADVLPDDVTVRERLSLYFDTCVVTYRMLHRQTVERWLAGMLRNREQGRSIAHSLGNARTASILVILAIAGLRCLKLKRKHSSSALKDPQLESRGLRESDPLFYASMMLTESETGFPTLESVQARLLQVLYLLQTGRMNKAWYTFGNACQIISSLGLHRKQHRQHSALGGQADYIEQQCAKRVFWTAYTIDKYISVVLGRPRLMHDEGIDQEFPDLVNDENMGPDGRLTSDAREECHVSSLIHHAKIAQLIGRISTEVYYKHRTDHAAAANVLVRELGEWRAELPPHLGTVKPSTLIPSFRREATALRLAYCHALFHATRPFLLGDSRHTFDNDPASRTKISECLSAARNALELIGTIVGDHELSHSFWWTQYVLFCALAVVYVWEIQRNAHQHLEDSGDLINASHETLYELAERSRSYLRGGAGSLHLSNPNSRYGLILEEVRLEAQRQVSQIRSRSARASLGTEKEAENRLHEAWSDQPMPIPAPTAELDITTSAILNSGSSMLESWQTTDWLDLDSSVSQSLICPQLVATIC